MSSEWTSSALLVPVSSRGAPNEPCELRRVEVRERGGLAVHPSVDHRDGWIVTHAASGKEVDCFFSKRKAEAFIEKILPFVDWTKDEEYIRGVVGLFTSVRYARKDVERS